MQKILYRSHTRGYADHGWLRSYHTFSFADYHNPERMGFGLLRVFNDDVIEPAQGFGMHSHRNMEIVSVPISGELRHEDSMGNRYVIKKNEIQKMSAGSGVMHSEYNNSETEPANFLQIWILAKDMNIEPFYGQKSFEESEKANRLQIVASPDEREGSIWMNQNSFLSLANLDAGMPLEYKMMRPGNGVFAFVISGESEIDGERVGPRDAIGILETETIRITAKEDSEFLFIEVPMK
ncbi:MAG: pirin family protein [Nitrospinota bacterium]|nr:pirin family protein [Nitrospinota bacterium]